VPAFGLRHERRSGRKAVHRALFLLLLPREQHEDLCTKHHHRKDTQHRNASE
jgi:hypothetical protein